MNTEELNQHFSLLATLDLDKSKLFSNKEFEYNAKFYKLPILK